MDNYYESAQDLIITQNRALVEVLDHGCDIWEFIADNGEHEFYSAQSVLNWLGY